MPQVRMLGGPFWILSPDLAEVVSSVVPDDFLHHAFGVRGRLARGVPLQPSRRLGEEVEPVLPAMRGLGPDLIDVVLGRWPDLDLEAARTFIIGRCSLEGSTVVE